MTAEGQGRSGSGGQLSAAARRERLQELATALGERAVVEGDRLVFESGGEVALYIHAEPGGGFELSWWRTATSPIGHPRWMDAAKQLTGDDEWIQTSALGGGFLVEVVRRAATPAEAKRLANAQEPIERVQELASAFPAAVAQLPAEPVPAYLLPPEPEEP